MRCVRCDRPICPECQRPASVGFQCPDDVRAGLATVRRGRTVVGAPVGGTLPLVSYLLIGLNVLVYLITALSPGGTLIDNTGSTLFGNWELVPVLVGYNHEYLRLVTAAFLHYGPIHIALNMFALYIIGPPLERVLGWWRFLVVYLLAALGGSVAILVLGDIRQPVVGASGAIFGLFAAALVLSRSVGFDTRSLLITIGINFIFTFSVPGISKLGHIGGFLVGGLATLALLGWSLQRRAYSQQLRTIQLSSLAGLLMLLVVAAVWRADEIHSELVVPVSSPAAVEQPPTAPDGSSTVWTSLGRTTPV
ncbi:MAG TPA: rhomboid family intramembrane serine protease [Jatrophihabitans sp.]|nr:rhomboid family intramembrane serine protease [Jatrophihabitans sp.]